MFVLRLDDWFCGFLWLVGIAVFAAIGLLVACWCAIAWWLVWLDDYDGLVYDC